MHFHYTARNQEGQVISHTAEAVSEAELVKRLREEGYFVTRVEPVASVTGKRSTVSAPAGPAVPARDLSIFFRELHHMLDAGMSLFQALTTQAESTANIRLKRYVRQMADPVGRGEPLADQLAKFPGAFEPLIVNMIRAGETSGRLDRMLVECSDYLERRFTLQQKIRRETIYPKLIAAAILVLPTIPVLVLQGGGSWLSSIVHRVAVMVPYIGAIAGGVYAWRAGIRHADTRATLDNIKLKLPLFGKVARRMALARFSRSLAALYASGVFHTSSLPVAADTAGNETIARDVKRIVVRVEKGTSLSDALAATGHFPPLVLQMLRTGEESGSIDAMLGKVADYYEQETETAIHQMTVALGPLLLLVAAVVVGTMVIHFYTGMAQPLVNAVGN